MHSIELMEVIQVADTNKKKRQGWKDLSTGRRARIVVTTILQCSLLIAALADIKRRPVEQINGKKWRWVALSFVNFIGPLAYFAFGRKR